MRKKWNTLGVVKLALLSNKFVRFGVISIFYADHKTSTLPQDARMKLAQ